MMLNLIWCFKRWWYCNYWLQRG